MITDNDAEMRNLWRAIGRLEANVERLIIGQERYERQQDERLSRLERRFDRMLWGLIGLGGGVIGLLIMEILRGA